MITCVEMDRRALLKGTAALSAAGVLSSLSSRVSAAQDDKNLTVWGVVSFTEEGDALLGQQMQEWGEQNGFTVEYVALPGSDYATRLATAVEAGEVPDVVMMLQDITLFYAEQGRLVDLTDVYNELKDLGGGMYETLLPWVQADGKIYSIPMQSDVSVMYARLDLIEEVTGERVAPATLDELEQIATQVNNPPQLYGIGLTVGHTLASYLLDEIESRVHDADVRLHRDGVDDPVSLDPGQECLVHAASEIFELVIDVGEVGQPSLLGVKEGVAFEHHHDIGNISGFDRGREPGRVIGPGQGDVFDLEAVFRAPLLHLLTEERVSLLRERDDAPDGEVIVLGRGAADGEGRDGGSGGERRRPFEEGAPSHVRVTNFPVSHRGLLPSNIHAPRRTIRRGLTG
jgi:hypothetical protein